MRGKTIVITGGFGALGRAVAEEARARGASVAQLDIKTPDGASDPLAFAVNLTDLEATSRVLNDIRAKTGSVDALLNIAGGYAWEPLDEGGVDTWERMFTLNVKTTLISTKAALPHLKESKGAIVNVGAFGAVKAAAGNGPYAASKQSVMKLTESLAAELKGHVRVNAVLPSTIDTAANRKDMSKADPSKWVQPIELARVMLFLASDDASAITGALVPVMGRV